MRYIKKYEHFTDDLIYNIDDYVYFNTIDYNKNLIDYNTKYGKKIKLITSPLCKIIKKFVPIPFPSERWDYVIQTIQEEKIANIYVTQEYITRYLTPEEIKEFKSQNAIREYDLLKTIKKYNL